MQIYNTITLGYQLTINMSLVKRGEDRRKRLNERNVKIRADYSKEWDRGFRTQKIIQDLASKYALAPFTVEAIVWEKDVYAKF